MRDLHLPSFRWIHLLLLLLISCHPGLRNDSEEILARVDDEYLYASELDGIMFPGVSAKDSLILSQNFINNWIRQKLLLKHAEKNLTSEQKDFSKQLEDYQNSLIIYKYETILIEQRLDTIVTEEEIEEYYNKNKNNFERKDGISPLSFEKKNIINYIVNRRKVKLINDLKKKTFSEAMETNKFEIY